MKSAIIAGIIMLLTIHGTVLAEEMVLDLHQTIDYAIQHNRTLQLSFYDEQNANYKIDEATAGFLPKLNFKSSYSQFGNIPISLIQLDPTAPPIAFQTQPDKVGSMSLSLTQPIYTGGLIINSYRLSRLGKDIARDKTQSTRADLVRQIKEAYYAILLARQLIKVSDESISVSEAHLKVAQSRYDVGMASRYDVLRGEVQVANLRPNLISMQNTLDTAKQSLGLLIGLDEGQTVDVNGELLVEKFELTKEECLAKAMTTRPELAMMRRNEEIAARSLDIARSALYPKIYLSGGYSHQLNDYSLGYSFSPSEWMDTWSGTLSLSWDIFDGWTAPAKIKQALVGKDQAATNRQLMEQAVRFEVENSYRSLQAARETLQSQEKNVENAQEGMRIADARYKEGLMQTVDVMDAQLALNSAETNYYKAIYDYEVALARLLKAMGEE